MTAPFIVLGLPRSRTFWLSRFLSYGEWHCGHEEARNVRGLEDARSWLSQPCTGTAETSAAPFWRMALRLRPDLRFVIVRRCVSDAVASMMRTGVGFDRAVLEATFRRLDAKLDQIAKRAPRVLQVSFADLNREDVCAKVFEFCLPYRHDHLRWEVMSQLNMQCDLRAIVRHYFAHRAQIDRATKIARQHELSALALRTPVEPDALTLRSEDWETFYPAARRLMDEHLAVVEQSPDAVKNWELLQTLDSAGSMHITSARSNGRMFGYLVTLIGPSLESPGEEAAVCTIFYAHKEFPGLGTKLQRFTLEALKERGVKTVFFRAGTHASNPRLKSIFHKVGAVPDGDLYRLELKE